MPNNTSQTTHTAAQAEEHGKRILPVHWSRLRWRYTQVHRRGDVVLYRRQHTGHQTVQFEVAVVQHYPERSDVYGNVREAGEYYPDAEQWGHIRWLFETEDAARAHARTLVAAGVGQARTPEMRAFAVWIEHQINASLQVTVTADTRAAAEAQVRACLDLWGDAASLAMFYRARWEVDEDQLTVVPGDDDEAE